MIQPVQRQMILLCFEKENRPGTLQLLRLLPLIRSQSSNRIGQIRESPRFNSFSTTENTAFCRAARIKSSVGSGNQSAKLWSNPGQVRGRIFGRPVFTPIRLVAMNQVVVLTISNWLRVDGLTFIIASCNLI